MQASSAHQQSHSRRASLRHTRPRRRFGADFEQFVRLRSGRTACISALRPGHAAALEAGFERLSAQSRYFRFLSPKSKLSEDELRYFTRIDGEHHYGLVARVLRKDGWDGAGIVRIVQNPRQPSRVELAVTILDEYQGSGLGTLLVDRILDAAAERGYDSLVAEVLAENRAMVRLLKRVAPGMRSVGSDPCVLELVVDLRERRRQLSRRPRAAHSQGAEASRGEAGGGPCGAGSSDLLNSGESGHLRAHSVPIRTRCPAGPVENVGFGTELSVRFFR